MKLTPKSPSKFSQLPPLSFSLFVIFLFLMFSSCKSRDPFQREAQTSTLRMASHFMENFENPKNEKGMRNAYRDINEKTKEHLSYAQFRKAIISTFPTGRAGARNVEITPWEKYDLEDGNALVYLLKKSDYSRIKFLFEKFSIIRLHLAKTDTGFSILFEKPEDLPILPIVEEGFCADLNNEKIEALREKIKEDLEKFKFNIELNHSVRHEDTLTKTCIEEGEKLYDKEDYRAALMQFQKALSIDPENEKAKTYMGRCQKAIRLSLSHSP